MVVTTDRDSARAHAASLLESGHPVLLESFLDGPEVSLFCLVDGETVVPCYRPRISSGSAMATPGPTRAEWAPTRRCRGCPMR